MADYEDTKNGVGSALPENAVATSWSDAEPLVTPQDVRRFHLWGIPLISAIKDPITRKPDVIDDILLKRYIIRAVSLVELEAGFDIFPKQYEEGHPYDQKASDSFGYMVLRHRPASSVESLAITSSDGVGIWNVPLAWISTEYLHQGQINLVPFAVASQGSTVPTVGPAGMGLLPSLFRFNWVPSLWRVKYTSGFKEGLIPSVVNELIGVVAAMEVLSQLATTFARSQSSSLGIDGLSQSASTPGPQVFAQRMDELGQKRKWLVNKLKRSFGLGMFSDNL